VHVHPHHLQRRKTGDGDRAIPPTFVITARIAPSNPASRLPWCVIAPGDQKLVAATERAVPKPVSRSMKPYQRARTGRIAGTSMIGRRSRPARAALRKDCCAECFPARDQFTVAGVLMSPGAMKIPDWWGGGMWAMCASRMLEISRPGR
jgi:hypothetical protein